MTSPPTTHTDSPTAIRPPLLYLSTLLPAPPSPTLLLLPRHLLPCHYAFQFIPPHAPPLETPLFNPFPTLPSLYFPFPTPLPSSPQFPPPLPSIHPTLSHPPSNHPTPPIPLTPTRHPPSCPFLAPSTHPLFLAFHPPTSSHDPPSPHITPIPPYFPILALSHRRHPSPPPHIIGLPKSLLSTLLPSHVPNATHLSQISFTRSPPSPYIYHLYTERRRTT